MRKAAISIRAPIGGYGGLRGKVNLARRIFLLAFGLMAFSAAFARAESVMPEDRVRIVAIGTSLTQGYNVAPGEDFCAMLEKRLMERGFNAEIVNAGVSGDTSAGGLARLDWALDGHVDGVMVELGANDALRGLSPADTRANLTAILDNLKARNLPVLLAGMMAPRNLGPDYAREFDAIFPELSASYQTSYYPFFLDGVASDLSLNQPDGIHPNEAGTRVIVERITPTVEAFIRKILAARLPETN
ncbi:MAG TPA: arylesterase [Micropepsaceae bacterium]|nr:arylesterase [Micropepsaceae bacterium]